MRNSLIFFKKHGNSKTFVYNNFDCCQSLGAAFKDKNYSCIPIMFVGIPISEMDEFFIVDDKRNLISYLELITRLFDIVYTLATEDETKDFDTSSTQYEKEQLIFIKVTTDVERTNKYFLVPYNMLRYLWYQHYTNMAIIATNLYNLNLFEDLIDIIAIAFSYQRNNERAVLPTETFTNKGLLFFRPKIDIQRELSKEGTNFNGVFYKYPIYFNPIVTIKGSFFTEVEMIVEAKELFKRLIGVVDIRDIPISTINNIKLIYDDYLLMKESYDYIKTFLDKDKLVISSGNPVFLSKEMKEVKIKTIDPNGTNRTLSIMLKASLIEDAVEDIKTEKPIAKKYSTLTPYDIW